MSSYSKFERIIASFLSRFPYVKSISKRIYTRAFYQIYKSDFDYQLDGKHEIISIDSSEKESFFGYYDKSPESNDGKFIIYQRISGSTKKSPRNHLDVEVVVKDTESEREVFSCRSKAFNWQQGTKLQWLTNDKFIFNDFKANRYVSHIVDVKLRRIIKTIDAPIYDTFQCEFALTTSFERLSVFAPDYGYFAHSIEKNSSHFSLDGIYKINLSSGKLEQILSLENVSRFEFDSSMKAVHTINHIMISPKGRSFMFIHRWYVDGQRFDRLIMSDLDGCMKVLVSEEMVSHCCWADENVVMGYFRYNSKNCYFKIDVTSGVITELFYENYSDGHPTIRNGNMLTDTYPNRRGLQELIVIDKLGNKSTLGKFRHHPSYFGECRCDLHPRLSHNNKSIFIDSILNGKRKLYRIDFSERIDFN